MTGAEVVSSGDWRYTQKGRLKPIFVGFGCKESVFNSLNETFLKVAKQESDRTRVEEQKAETNWETIYNGHASENEGFISSSAVVIGEKRFM